MAEPILDLFGIKKVVAWVALTGDELGASLNSTALTATLNTGQGVNYADASALVPHKIRIDGEILKVTLRSADVITVARNVDGTTAANHNNAADIIHLYPIRFTKGNSFTLNTNPKTIEFPGDGDVEQRLRGTTLTGEIAVTKFNLDILQRAAGIPVISTGLRDGETRRFYPEEGTYPPLELNVDYVSENDVNGVEEAIRLIVFSARLQKPLTLGNSTGDGSVQTTTFPWTSESVTTDIAGIAHPGESGAERHYTYAELT